ncbi:MAG: NAD(P)/FAD-dependent oxidoreductase [archaeon]
MEYDVVVVGAGPGGSSTAKYCAAAGLDTLLVEKRKEIGAPKRCGEGLTVGGMKRVGLKPEPEWARQKIMGAIMFSPSLKRVDIEYKPYGGYVIERKIFDKRLAELAAENGAKVQAGVRATGLIKNGNQVTGVKLSGYDGVWDVKAKVVVAADGVESLVGRWAGLNTKHLLQDTCSGAQFEMCNIDPISEDQLEVYMGNEIAPGGYIWIFPKGKHVANVGIGTRGTNGSALYYLKKFIQSKDNLKKGSILEINTGNIPVGGPVDQLSTDGLVLVGDAAHQVNAVHGGGIPESMRAGEIASKTIKRAIDANDYTRNTLKQYDEEWFAIEGKRLKRVAIMKSVIEKLSDKDLDYLAEHLSGDQILDITRASQFTLLAKIFGKRPSLLKHVPKLLTAV